MIGLVLYFYAFSAALQAHATANISVTQMTNGSTLCTNTHFTQVVATSTSGRNLFFISNFSALPIFLDFGNTATGTGYMLNASSTLRFDSSGSYGGAIYCEGLEGTATSTWTDSQN